MSSGLHKGPRFDEASSKEYGAAISNDLDEHKDRRNCDLAITSMNVVGRKLNKNDMLDVDISEVGLSESSEEALFTNAEVIACMCVCDCVCVHGCVCV